MLSHEFDSVIQVELLILYLSNRNCIAWLAVFTDVTTTTAYPTDLAKGEEKMSEYILQILEHFKQRNPVGIPGAKVPDPYSVPDMKQSISIGTLYFKNTAVYGISKFRILYVNAEIGAMEVRKLIR